jgi:hypothetical protein
VNHVARLRRSLASLAVSARNYDLMADNLEALLSIHPSVKDAKAS